MKESALPKTIVKVFTKGESMPFALFVPTFVSFGKEKIMVDEDGDAYELLVKDINYRLHHFKEGLCGVKYGYYRRVTKD